MNCMGYAKRFVEDRVSLIDALLRNEIDRRFIATIFREADVLNTICSFTRSTSVMEVSESQSFENRWDHPKYGIYDVLPQLCNTFHTPI